MILVVLKVICNRITAAQQNIRLVALAMLQSQEEGPSSRMAQAWLT